jgi:hypothetical protein
MVLVFAVAAGPLLKIVFDVKGSAGALPWLGLAMSLLALTYLCAQFQLALHRVRFIAALVVAAVVEPLVLLVIGAELTPLALGLLAVQAVLASVMLTLALRRPAVGARSGASVDEAEPVLTEA